jgi:hypothetical protein
VEWGRSQRRQRLSTPRVRPSPHGWPSVTDSEVNRYSLSAGTVTGSHESYDGPCGSGLRPRRPSPRPSPELPSLDGRHPTAGGPRHRVVALGSWRGGPPSAASFGRVVRGGRLDPVEARCGRAAGSRPAELVLPD